MAGDDEKTRSSLLRFLLGRSSNQWIFLILIAFVIFFSIAARGFFSILGIRNIAVFVSEPLLLTVGETFVIISGGIDLSVGAVLGFTGVVGALIMRGVWGATQSIPLSFAVSIVAGLAIGTTLGTINGLIIAKLRVPPFVVTLGMLGIARGITFVITSGQAIIGLPDALGAMGNLTFGGLLPVTTLSAIVLVVIAYIALSKTRIGRYAFAIGGNRQAAVRSGVPVARYTIIIYAISGFLAGWAGFMLLARFGTGSPLSGQNSELNAIAAAVIGGTSLMGGIGTIGGAVIGSLIIVVLLVGLVIMNVQPYWQMAAVGFILISAVFIDNLRHGKSLED